MGLADIKMSHVHSMKTKTIFVSEKIILKIRLILFLFVAFLNASAQRQGFSLEPYMGLGTSEAVQNGTNNLGGRIGLGCVYMFNDHWGVSSGL